MPAQELANRYGVTERTIYRDMATLAAAGIPVQATPGKTGGYRLGPDTALDPLTIDSDHALRLYVLGFVEPDTAGPDRARAAGISDTVQDVVRRLAQRIHFDTADWYWRDEGSGHLPVLRTAMLTGIVLDATWRTNTGERATALLKPYGAVWKAGEWHMAAAPATGGAPEGSGSTSSTDSSSPTSPSPTPTTSPSAPGGTRRWRTTARATSASPSPSRPQHGTNCCA
ncbi:HTH domain-containing protein [Streptomyces sp. NPDC051909]|uniref:helix-turn-helix transcriptional regulator n=1 Tax=Streptomyces sp. NPDC051909 TaxID=3154944 RepID=UPI00343C3A7D